VDDPEELMQSSLASLTAVLASDKHPLRSGDTLHECLELLRNLQEAATAAPTLLADLLRRVEQLRAEALVQVLSKFFKIVEVVCDVAVA